MKTLIVWSRHAIISTIAVAKVQEWLNSTDIRG